MVHHRLLRRTQARSIYLWKFDDFFGPAQAVKVEEAIPEKSLLLASGAMRIVVEFSQEGDIGVVTLNHRGFPPGDPLLEGCRSGWLLALAQLKFYLENYEDYDRQELLVLHPASAPAETIHALLSDPKQRRNWLLVDDPPSETLADSGTELLMKWDAIGGVLELKQFSWNDGRYLCLRASSWSREYDLAYQKAGLRESLETLALLAR